jgi:hypothetical protein
VLISLDHEKYPKDETRHADERTQSGPQTETEQAAKTDDYRDVLTVPPGGHQKRDAVCCCLEHYSGETVNVFVPYVKAADGEIQYGEIFAAKRTGQFFCELPSC